MSSSDYSKDSNSDEDGDKEVVRRECDDMLARRLAGNMPAPLRKKNDTFKHFITPTGNPMMYIKQHARSQSVTEIQVERKEKNQERDERNNRYEELQELKDLLKEEEETWTSNLDNWKQRRRSVTIDVRKRKEDRDSVMHQAATSSRRRAKTYREIIEDKKRRESGLFLDDSDDYSSSVFSNDNDNNNNIESKRRVTSAKKLPYRGATSVPNFAVFSNTDQNSSLTDTKMDSIPVKLASEPAVIEQVSKEEESSPDSRKANLPDKFDGLSNGERPPQSEGNSLGTLPLSHPLPSASTSSSPAKSPAPPIASIAPFCSAAPPVNTDSNAYHVPVNHKNQRSVSPPPSTYSSINKVEMRKKSPNSNRERPKSAYSSMEGRASTLPRNYHQYSAPKPFKAGVSSFVKFRKTAFANKRSQWENKSQEEPEAPRPPVELASLLKQDTEKLHGSEQPADKTASLNGPAAIQSHQSSAAEQVQTNAYAVPLTHSSQKPHTVSTEPEHKPKIMSSHNNANKPNTSPIRSSWLRSEQSNVLLESKPGYRRVNAPLSRASWSKTATLPTRMRPTPVEDRQDLTKQNSEHQSTKGNEVALKSSHFQNHLIDSFKDVKICISQRPKSEMGFGFTVRGGDDGKPVVVNAVSPGGAADVCHLLVGDEIRAINDVLLSPSLTQDGIVQLIVDSVITGNLSLEIRRYKEFKNSSSTSASGSKSELTSESKVQVRTNEGMVSAKTRNYNPPSRIVKKDFSGESCSSNDDYSSDISFPRENGLVVDIKSQERAATIYSTSNLLSDLIEAANSTSIGRQGSENQIIGKLAQNEERSDEDDSLQYEVLKFQRVIDTEESSLANGKVRNDKDRRFREQLLLDQRLIEEKESKRDEDKIKRLEEEREDAMKIEKELRKIEERRQKQQKKREEEKRRLKEGVHTPSQRKSTFNQSEMNHWLIEEAERSRLADNEGKQRVNAFDSTMGNNARSPTTDPVNHRGTRSSHAQAANPHIPGKLRDHWNDPSTRATLL